MTEGQTATVAARYAGSRVHRVEDARLVTGAGTFERGMRLVAATGDDLYRRPLLAVLALQLTETYFPGIPLVMQRGVIGGLAALARRVHRRRLAVTGF